MKKIKRPNKKNVVHPKISSAITSFIESSKREHKFYGLFLHYVNFHEVNDQDMKTMQTYFSKSGMNIDYDYNYVEDCDVPTIAGTLAHEVGHLISFHALRSINFKMNHKWSNLSQDIIINHNLKEHYSHYKTGLSNIKLHSEDFCEFPPGYDGREYFEELYMWLVKMNTSYEREKSEHSQRKLQKKYKYNPYGDKKGLNFRNEEVKKEIKDLLNGEEANKLSDLHRNDLEKLLEKYKDDSFEQESPESFYERPDKDGIYKDGFKSEIDAKLRKLLDFMDIWENGMSFDSHCNGLQDGVSENEAYNSVQSVMDTLRSRGLIPGGVDKLLESMKPKKTDYLKFVKRVMPVLFKLQKEKTYSVPNLYGIEGIKGFKKHGFTINWIMDVSGSMDSFLEKVAEFMMQKNIQINLIQIDTEITVQKCITFKDFKKFKVKGLGGTVLQPAIDKIKTDKNYKNYHTVITTDGCTDELDFAGYNKNVLMITTDEKSEVRNLVLNLLLKNKQFFRVCFF